jgi:hypothetical protein
MDLSESTKENPYPILGKRHFENRLLDLHTELHKKVLRHGLHEPAVLQVLTLALA